MLDELTTGDLVEGLGRSDTPNYHVGAYTGDAKHHERCKVLNFICEHVPKFLRMRLLSMPGTDWTFENMLMRQHRNIQMVGIEKSLTIYHRAKVALPGRHRNHAHDFDCLSERQAQYGTSVFEYSRVRAYKPVSPNEAKQPTQFRGDKGHRSNRLLLISASEFTGMFVNPYNATLDQKRNWFRRFFNRNAVWLDFTSQISREVEATLANLHFVMQAPESRPHAVTWKKPVVITVMNARDRFHSAQERAEYIESITPAFKVETWWTYTGKNGVSMLTVAGHIT